MAKMNGRIRLTIGIISVTLVVLGMIITGVLAYGDTSNKTEVNATNITELKEDGCKPARKAGTDIEVIKEKLETIDVRQETMRKENKASFKEILEKL